MLTGKLLASFIVAAAFVLGGCGDGSEPAGNGGAAAAITRER